MNRLILVMALLAGSSSTACAPSLQAIQTAVVQTQQVWTPIPTQTSQSTYTPPPTYTALVIVQTKIVTETFTVTAEFTPTKTGTPLPATPTANETSTAAAMTLDVMRLPKGDGFFLVNTDIAPGVWRSTGTGTECLWSVTAKDGTVLSSHFGVSGGSMNVPATAFQVQIKSCGQFVFSK